MAGCRNQKNSHMVYVSPTLSHTPSPSMQNAAPQTRRVR
jgi:hypothetical protein